MPAGDDNGTEPNLELPSLGFGFRRKKKRAEAADDSAETPVEAPVEAPAAPEDGADPAVAENEGSRLRSTDDIEGPADTANSSTGTTEASTDAADEPTEVITAPAVEDEPTAVIPTTTAEPAAAQDEGSRLRSSDEDAGSTDIAAGSTDDDAEPKPPREPFLLPHVPGQIAALVTGIVAGFVCVLLAYGAARGCESVRGVGSCGGFGLFALIAITAIEVLVGAVFLKGWDISDPTSTSFLAVGTVAVIVMVFFLSHIDSKWMLLVIPVLTALAYLGSWWVSRRFIDVAEEVRS